MSIRKVDVAIVGAGSAGAAAAAQCAHRGMVVALLDARPMDRAGACWANLIPRWFFEEAGIPAPQSPELQARPAVHHLLAGHGPQGLQMRGDLFFDVDMRLLTRRLQQAAHHAGAMLHGEVRVTGWDGRLLQTSGQTLEPRWVVDASGLHGVRLLGQPPPGPRSICDARQQIHRVARRAEAISFLAARGVAERQVLNLGGLYGGFSTVTVRLDGEHLGLLVGTVPGDGHPPAAEILAGFIQRHRWIGERIYGGGRQIPIRRPYDVLARGRVALLGDAASQVFPPHGSGVGFGLVAARMLADALDEERGVEGYAADFQRRHGGNLAAHDLFRRFQQDLPRHHLGHLMAAGLMTEQALLRALIQRSPRPGARDLARLLWGSRRAPELAAQLSRLVIRMGLVKAYYQLYPARESQVASWAARLERLGLRPDP